MNADTYRVVLTGHLEPGFERAAVATALADRFRISPEKAQGLVNGSATTVKSGIDAATAARFEQAVLAAGASCHVAPESIPETESRTPRPPPMAPMTPMAPTAGEAPEPTPLPSAPTPHADVYAPPQASLLDEDVNEGVHRPQNVGAGRGFGWLFGGLGLFWQAKLGWFLVALTLSIIALVSALIPYIGPVVFSIVLPIFLAGVALGADRQYHGGEIGIGDLFGAFRSRPWLLAGVGGIYFVGSLAIMFVVGGIMAAVMGGGMFLVGNLGSEIDPATAGVAITSGIAVFGVIGLTCAIPLYMAIWFAPALIALNEDLTLTDALRLSFSGCWRNSLGFVLYGLGLIIIATVATIPFLIGWLIAAPLVLASHYVSYREIYVD